jgi:hypothetical protein
LYNCGEGKRTLNNDRLTFSQGRQDGVSEAELHGGFRSSVFYYNNRILDFFTRLLKIETTIYFTEARVATWRLSGHRIS